MSENEDDSSKTEEPSPKKLEEARKKGQIASSRELAHFSMMAAFLAIILMTATHLSEATMKALAPFITESEKFEMDSASVANTMRDLAFVTLGLLLIPLLITVVAAIAPAIIQHKIVFSAEHITPKFSKISPLTGFSRLFGMKAMIEFIKNLLKIVIVGAICVFVALPYQAQLPQIMNISSGMIPLLEFTQTIAGKTLIGVCIFLFLLSIGDYLYQRFIILKSLRMSRQELKDEYKQQEGDPHVKQKIRQMRRERVRKNMMANVPKADVVITNPTHYAVALHYDADNMQAPVVLAKGADTVAGRIRELATEHKIPIVRNPPLARVLYDTTDVDDSIPVEHYQAVAKIIGYVYRLKGKTLSEDNSGKGKYPKIVKKK